VLSFTTSMDVHYLDFLGYKFVRNLSKCFVQYSLIYKCVCVCVCVAINEDFVVHNLFVGKLTSLVTFLSSNDHSSSISNSQSLAVCGIIR
jgi:hypothetical protein